MDQAQALYDSGMAYIDAHIKLAHMSFLQPAGI